MCIRDSYRSVINGLNGEGVGDIDGAAIDVLNGVEEGGLTSEVLSEGNGPGGLFSVEGCGTNDFGVVVLIDNREVVDGEGSGFTIVGVGEAEKELLLGDGVVLVLNTAWKIGLDAG